jgi:hypothetical protein
MASHNRGQLLDSGFCLGHLTIDARQLWGNNSVPVGLGVIGRLA